MKGGKNALVWKVFGGTQRDLLLSLPELAFEALIMSMMMMVVAISCDEENDDDDVNDNCHDGDVDVIDDEKKDLP